MRPQQLGRSSWPQQLASGRPTPELVTSRKNAKAALAEAGFDAASVGLEMVSSAASLKTEEE